MDIEGKQRVNRITTTFNDQDGVTVTLYRTHNKLGQLTSDQLGIPKFSDSKTQNKNAYMAYCRETVINLLENGGVEGFYYDSVNRAEQATNGMPKKFDDRTLAKYGKSTLESKLDEVANTLGKTMMCGYSVRDDIEVIVTDRYSDGNIKFGSVPFITDIYSNTEKDILTVKIPVEIKSGQMCKPKEIYYEDNKMSFNPTNIKNLLVKKGYAQGAKLDGMKLTPTATVRSSSNIPNIKRPDDNIDYTKVEEKYMPYPKPDWLIAKLAECGIHVDDAGMIVRGADGSPLVLEPQPNISIPAPKVEPEFTDADIKLTPQQEGAKKMLDNMGVDHSKIESYGKIDNKSAVSRLMGVLKGGSNG